jgi:hypothetical protein
MQIFVRTIDERTLTFDVESQTTVDQLKQLVQEREGARPIDCLSRSFDISIIISFQVSRPMSNVSLWAASHSKMLSLSKKAA